MTSTRTNPCTSGVHVMTPVLPSMTMPAGCVPSCHHVAPVASARPSAS